MDIGKEIKPTASERQIVRCPQCQVILYTMGKKFFRHCGGEREIASNLYQQRKPIVVEPEIAVAKENPETLMLPNANGEMELTVDEDEETDEYPVPVEKNFESKSSKEEFFCPSCNHPVTPMNDCVKCGEELIWSDD